MNSRDELALSQAINIPHRGLAHQQFTALRKVAREKNMPMFQVVLVLNIVNVGDDIHFLKLKIIRP